MLPRKRGGSDGEFIRRVLIFVGIAALAAALYKLSDVVLLIFGAILVAVVVRALARPIRAGTSMSERLALLASGFGIAALLVGIGYLFGAQISDQLSSLTASLPQAAQRLSQTVPGQSITAMVKGSSIGDLLMNALSWGTTIFGAVAALVVVIVAGLFIAARPEVYRDGFVMLFPKTRQTEIADTIDAAGEALRLWLGAQLLAMIIVGILIAVGLALVGVPSALALGLIAGVAEFVPIVGPVIGAIPALLLASTQDWHTVVWTLGGVRRRAADRKQPDHAARRRARRGVAASGRTIRGRCYRCAVRAAGAGARLSTGHRNRCCSAQALCARHVG